MEETCKKSERGTIVIIALIVAAILMILSGYFLNSLITEIKITRSVIGSEKAYYLAEGGVNEAIKKLKNNDEWKGFTDPDLNPDSDGNYWSQSLRRDDFETGSYRVEVQNIRAGEAKIRAVGESPFMNNISKREIEVRVSKALDSPTEESPLFTGGAGSNIRIHGSDLVINDGNIFSNHNLLILSGSRLKLFNDENSEKLQGKLLATGNIQNVGGSDLEEYTALCSRNYCTEECLDCPPDEVSMPVVDFDSQRGLSFKSLAERDEDKEGCRVTCNPKDQPAYTCSEKCIFGREEFNQLLWEVGKEGELILRNEVTYITGSVELRGARKLDVRGALVADGSIEVGMRDDWRRQWQRDRGFSHIKVSGPDNTPSGLLSKKDIKFGSYALREESLIEGAIYAGDKVNLVGIPEKLIINGGILGRQIHFHSIQSGFEMNYDNELLLLGLGYIVGEAPVNPIFSPVIEVGHWEEVY